MNKMNFIDVGFSNFVEAGKIINISQVDSSPIKRLIKQAKEQGRFIDMTQGRKTRTIIYSECGDQVILTAVAVHASTVINRINRSQNFLQAESLTTGLVEVKSSELVH